MKKILFVLLFSVFLVGCSDNCELDNEDETMRVSRREYHQYEITEYELNEYVVLKKGKAQVICQAEVLSTVYHSDSGEYYSFSETACEGDPTYYLYYEFDYLTLNEAVDVGIITDADAVEFCENVVLVKLN